MDLLKDVKTVPYSQYFLKIWNDGEMKSGQDDTNAGIRFETNKIRIRTWKDLTMATDFII